MMPSRPAPRPASPEPAPRPASPLANAAANRALLARLDRIRARCVALERREGRSVAQVDRHFRPSARNLLHYVALRQQELRRVQDALSLRGLSSLGRCESHVLAALDAVRTLLALLPGGRSTRAASGPANAPRGAGVARLRRNTTALFGPPAEDRWVRIMVTLPTEAAQDYGLVRELVRAGMNVARVNCAHDDHETWGRMVAHVRRAERELSVACRVMTDLAGPKLRTGAVELGAPIVSFQPERDERRWPTAPAQVLVHRPGAALKTPRPPVDAVLPVEGELVRRVHLGDELRFYDSRRRRRLLRVTAAEADGVWRAECLESAWVEAETPIELLSSIFSGSSPSSGGQTWP